MLNIVVAATLLFVTPIAATPAVEAPSLQVLGQVGVLGEWELTAKVSSTDAGVGQRFSGPLLMTHVGICSVDGPEKKTGELQLQLTEPSHIRATLVVEGVTCTYAGRKSDSYSGVLRCPDRRDVPLLMWLK